MKKGIFWCKDFNTPYPKLITVSVSCDKNGFSDEIITFSSKSGENFNHKAEWTRLNKSVSQGKTFNYYPRGRVEIKNGKATVFLHPDINTDRILRKIVDVFELTANNGLKSISFKSDGSEHYRYTCTDA